MKKGQADKERLNHILDCILFVERHTAGKTFEDFEDDEVLSFAILKQLEIIGEAANNLSGELTNANPEIEWAKIVGARHVFVHAYFNTDWNTIWQIATDSVPPMKEKIRKIIQEL